MTDNQLSPLNDLMKIRIELELNKTWKGLDRLTKQFDAIKFDFDFPRYENIIPKDFLNLSDRLDATWRQQAVWKLWSESMSKSLSDIDVIRDMDAVRKVFEQNSFIPNNLSLATRIQAMDVSTSINKMLENIPDYGDILKNSTKIPFAGLYENIFNQFDKEAFNKTFSSDGLEDDVDFSDEYEEVGEEDIKIVNPTFYNVSVQLVTYVNLTDMHVTNNYTNSTTEEERTKSFWEKWGKPTLLKLGAFFMIWATSTDPIGDMAIVKCLTNIAHAIQEYAAEHLEEPQTEIEEPTKGELNKFDSIDSENNVG